MARSVPAGSAKLLIYASLFATSAGLAALLLPEAFVSTAVALIVGATFFLYLQQKDAPPNATPQSVQQAPPPAQLASPQPSKPSTTEAAVMSPLPPRTPAADSDADTDTIDVQEDPIKQSKDLLSDSHLSSSLTPRTTRARAEEKQLQEQPPSMSVGSAKGWVARR